MKPELVVMRAIYEPTIAELERDFTVHRLWLQKNADAFLRERGGNVKVVITTTPYGFSPADFAWFPKLELLGCFGPYYTLIDRSTAKQRGIPVTHTPGSTAEPVADLRERDRFFREIDRSE